MAIARLLRAIVELKNINPYPGNSWGKIMREQFLCGVAAIAISAAIGGTSLAADLPVKARPVAAPNWAGLYIGGHLGWGQAKIDTISHDDESVQNKPSGIVGGMHVGQNWQNNTFVYGWEADLSATGWDQHALFPAIPDRSMTTNVELLASLRGRLGLAFDRTLLYVTGGLAYTHGKFLQVSPSGGTKSTGKYNKFGGVVGGGAEWKQSQNFSWRVEGLYYMFNHTQTFTNVEDDVAQTNLKDAFVIRVGATHHF